MIDGRVGEHELHKDLCNLRSVGQQRGFPSRLRRKIWMILLGIEDSLVISQSQEVLEQPHDDERQVNLDVERAFTMALPKSIEESSIPALKGELEQLIDRALRRHPWLHYYQGYHDIAQITHLVLGNAAEAALERLNLQYLRDFMLSSLQPSMSMLRLVPQIVRVADPDYAEVLAGIEPFYAISPLLTWWTHSLESYQDACRVMDFCLSSGPSMIIYTIAAATLLRRKEVMANAGDRDMIFLVLTREAEMFNLEEVLQKALELSEHIKLKQLQYWRQISGHSALKTFEIQYLGTPSSSLSDAWRVDARIHFEAQELELKRQQKANVPKKPSVLHDPARLGILAIGVGVLAVGLAWYAQQQGVIFQSFQPRHK